jgi:hypothetical protein
LTGSQEVTSSILVSSTILFTIRFRAWFSARARVQGEGHLANPSSPRYIDHPVPSAAMMVLLLLLVVGILVSIPALVEEVSQGPGSWIPIAVVGLTFMILCFYFWPLLHDVLHAEPGWARGALRTLEETVLLVGVRGGGLAAGNVRHPDRMALGDPMRSVDGRGRASKKEERIRSLSHAQRFEGLLEAGCGACTRPDSRGYLLELLVSRVVVLTDVRRPRRSPESPRFPRYRRPWSGHTQLQRHSSKPAPPAAHDPPRRS